MDIVLQTTGGFYITSRERERERDHRYACLYLVNSLVSLCLSYAMCCILHLTFLSSHNWVYASHSLEICLCRKCPLHKLYGSVIIFFYHFFLLYLYYTCEQISSRYQESSKVYTYLSLIFVPLPGPFLLHGVSPGL